MSVPHPKTLVVGATIAKGPDAVAERDGHDARCLTFREAAEELIEPQKPGWRNAKHVAQWASTLETCAHPILGPLDVRDVGVEHVLQVLQPIWTTKTETATRVRQRIEAVLDYAVAKKAREGENPARWRGGLDRLLANPTDLKDDDAHHAALPWQEMGTFYDELEGRDGMGALGLRFAILTAARSGEVRGATWQEIDLDAATWTVTARRMKARREHRGPLSDMTLSAVLRRMKREHISVHGLGG